MPGCRVRDGGGGLLDEIGRNMNRPVGDPLPDGVESVERWGFVLDNLPEAIGGGFSAGEFLLRSDGLLLRRSVSSSYSGNETTWHADPWTVFHRFVPGTKGGRARSWLIDLQYELGDPTPVPITQHTAGPYPGMPKARVLGASEARAKGRRSR